MKQIRQTLTWSLVALAYGVIPVAMMPSSGLVFPFGSNYEFPYPSSPFLGAHTLWLFLLPVVYMLYAVVKGRYAYHGIWMTFLAFGMLWKFQAMPAWMLSLVFVVGVCGLINFIAFKRMTGAEVSEIIRIRHGKAEHDRQMASSDGALGNANNKGSSVRYSAVRSKTTFANLVGMHELKDRLLKAGKEVVAKKGARNGILLTGEPGNGKTAMAEALAGSLKLPLISVSFGDFASQWVGQTTERVMKVFDDAESQAPCVLFIDEAEAVLIDREKVSFSESEAPKTVSAVLKRIVDLRSKGVVLVAATNYIENMDKAAIREGRFDYKIEITPPDEEARIFLLSSALQKHQGKVERSGLERAAKRWEGFSVARICAVGSEAMAALEAGDIENIGFDELMAALRKVQAGKGTKIPEDVPTLEMLVFEEPMRKRLASLSRSMMDIERIEEMGGTLPTGVLFHGPSGTGKTRVAMSLAKTTKWSFLATTGQDLLTSADEIDRLIAKAKDMRPCIVFIDEADDVLADRRMSPMSKQVTNKLIAAMDGAGGRTRDMIYVAATNAPDLIDEAALRGGRFTEKVGFTLPSRSLIAEYVKTWQGKTKAKFDSAATPEAIADMLVGQSFANINEILQGAVNHSIANDMNQVSIEDVENSAENFLIDEQEMN